MNFRILAAAFAALSIAASSASAESLVERGAYLSHNMDCGGCHHTGVTRPPVDAGVVPLFT